MLNELPRMLELNLSFSDVIINLFVSLICSLLIVSFYKRIYNGPGYLNSFLHSMVILSMITTVVIMVIGNNLARAFGLVGAMSIIRFRTAVKETLDIIFIFFSLAVGMAAGVGFHFLAISSTIIIGSVFWVLSKMNIITHQKREYLLQFSTEGEGNEQSYLDVMEKHCNKYTLINAKSDGDDMIELSYYVSIKHREKGTQLLQEMKKLGTLKRVRIFFDEEYF